MDKKINSLVQKYVDDELVFNKLVVTAFIRHFKQKVSDGYLSSYLLPDNNEYETEVSILAQHCTLEDLITIFEQAIPLSEKTAKGAVYTPEYVRSYIVNKVMQSSAKEKLLQECLCADVACGCGAFLANLAEYICSSTGASFAKIIPHLYGIDISEISIGRAKLLLAMVALLHGEELTGKEFNLYCGDSLNFDFLSLPRVKMNGGFDVIVGNPPYVRARNIEKNTREKLAAWETAKVGNVDLYIPFFEIGLRALSSAGYMGYITVSTFFKSVNARALRRLFAEKSISLSIVDFGEELVFRKKLAYTCLVFLSKHESDTLQYAKASISHVKNQKALSYSSIRYESLNHHQGWHLNRSDILDNIHRIESAGDALGEKFNIRNGIATLANDVYIFRPVMEDERFYYLLRNEKKYPIEKTICRNIIKPNILKHEGELKQKMEKIIFPYDDECHVIEEPCMMSEFPCSYAYLSDCRYILDARDKGEGKYETWYAFGRTQALSDRGRRLMFPYMSNSPHFVYSDQEDMLIYCGYALYHDSEQELLVLKKVLESDIFDYYIRHTSKPYATGYYSYAKNYVKKFGIYPFSAEQKKHLLNLKNKTEVNEYLLQLYDLRKDILQCSW